MEELPGQMINEVLPEVVESTVKNVDDLANNALHKFVERVPVAAKAVAAIDEALAGVACSCGLFGWTLSASRSRRSPAKSEAPLSEVSK